MKFNDDGATAVEYGLIAGLIALGVLGSLIGVRGSLNQDYGCIATSVGSAGGTPCASAAAAAPATPTTAMGYAVQMVPAGRSVTGVTMNNSGVAYNWFCGSGDPSKVGNTSTNLCVTTDPSYRQSYYFTGTTIASNVYQISSYGGAPVQHQSGAITYGVITPQGWIMVETLPSAQ
jgi:Flp pilus assembly pilin Flp